MRFARRTSGLMFVAGVLGLGAAFGQACSAKKVTEIMVIIDTDIPIPKDIDSLELFYEVDGKRLPVAGRYSLSPRDGVRLPASIGFVLEGSLNTELTVQVDGMLGGARRVSNRVHTGFVEGEVNFIKVPLSLPCYDVLDCREKTCKAGKCNDVRESESAAYTDKDAPNTDPKLPGCYDPGPCLNANATALVAATTGRCRYLLGSAEGTPFTIALNRFSSGPGYCNTSGCRTPLNQDDEEGWRFAPGTSKEIELSQNLCDLVEAKKYDAVEVSIGCGTKTVTRALCRNFTEGDAGVPDVRVDTATDSPVDSRVDSSATDSTIDVLDVLDAVDSSDVLDATDAADTADTKITDTAPIDTGLPDTGPPDTGIPDTGPVDTGTPDTGPPDTGPADTGPLDTGIPDTGPPDTGPADTGATCSRAGTAAGVPAYSFNDTLGPTGAGTALSCNGSCASMFSSIVPAGCTGKSLTCVGSLGSGYKGNTISASSGTFGVSFWMRTSSTPTDDHVILGTMDDPASGGFQVGYLPNPLGGARVLTLVAACAGCTGGPPGGGVAPVPFSGAVSLDVWHYVEIRIIQAAGGAMSLSVDGTTVTRTLKGSESYRSGGGLFTVCAQPNLSRNFNGLVDEINIYNGTL